MSECVNQLGGAASAYLRSARHQPVAWHEWGEAAFARARAEHKAVLLDVGAVWCHWCHVMDRESYEDGATAALINELFVAVKVDRDERPDVDARYQAAVAAISGQGGWPLTAFLTPEGKPYFGGTYFPREERYGRPGFQRVLRTMADVFANQHAEVEESAGSVMEAIEQSERFPDHAGRLEAGLLNAMLAGMLEQFDERNGGFGSEPKFPHSAALDLLIDAAGRGSADGTGERAQRVAAVTLRKMAAGGIQDQLAGGFHRYSVDERWIVPHFEKMAYDNSELLKNYAHGFAAFGDAGFAAVARGVVRWMDEWLSDRERGGFYSSQDADASVEDDGNYFTWSLTEAAGVLELLELEVARRYYNLRPVGDMRHDPERCVLHVGLALERVAEQVQLPVAEAESVLASARGKLYAARLERPTPYVDRTMYTGWNGMCISAYVAAGRALGLRAPVAFALRSLDRVLASAWQPEAGLAHVVAYGEGVAGRRIAGNLDDYAALASGALDAWEASGEARYFQASEALAVAMLERFCDVDGERSSGFFDTEADDAAIGALRARRKPLQDSPTPAGNAVAAMLLVRLHALTGKDLYRRRAQETLETFAGVVGHLGLYAASYGLSLRRLLEPPVQICVVQAGPGDDALADALEATALRGYAVNKSVIRLRPDQLGELPRALAETLPHLPSGLGSCAVVCRGTMCLPPVVGTEELTALLAG